MLAGLSSPSLFPLSSVMPGFDPSIHAHGGGVAWGVDPRLKAEDDGGEVFLFLDLTNP